VDEKVKAASVLVVVVGQESMLVSGDVVSAGVALGGCGVGVLVGV
jgi:hypothetical protein